MGTRARSRRPSAISRRGERSRSARYTFSSVLRFMCGHSLQAHDSFIGGAAMSVLSGAPFFIWCKIPGSVATMNVCLSEPTTYFSRLVVEPMNDASFSTASSHSGCATISAPGFRSISPTSFRSLKVSWTRQLPGQWIIARPVTFSRYRPRLRSGAKRIVRSSGMARTIFSAFDDVQM